ncbi:hypothetical protein CELL_00223 [Cellulomonas sp. T2.31MG-18]|uniref:DUF721 domain-containing protein n=1 Tax=Cellulomonas sp. T2.31MG-18 TaxID=3157619 RepID=UPI0035E5017D
MSSDTSDRDRPSPRRRAPAPSQASGRRRAASTGSRPTAPAAAPSDGGSDGPSDAAATWTPTPPAEVARRALARAVQAARARGVRPGQRSRAPLIAPPTAAGPDGRDPQPLGRIVGRLVNEHGWQGGLVAGQLQNRWAELVGPMVAENLRFVSFEAGLLVAQASSTSWRTQLVGMEQELLRAFAARLGEDVVLEVRVLGPSTPTFNRGPRTVRGRGARDTWG